MNPIELLEELDFWELDKLARKANARGVDVEPYYGCLNGECCEEYFAEWREETIKSLTEEIASKETANE